MLFRSNGDITSYNAFIDHTQIGQISKMAAEKTNERDGIEIVIPAKEGDFSAFRDKALSLFSHFKVRPEIEGADEENFYGEDAESLMFSDDWTIRKSGNSVAVMGNIAYPISTSALDLSYGTNEYSLVDEVSLCLYFEIGDLDISASREALQYTDETKRTITKRLKSVSKQIPKKVGEEMKDCKNLWEAKTTYGKLFKHGGLGHVLRSVIDHNTIFWNGKKVSDNHFTFAKKDDAIVRQFAEPYQYSNSKRVKMDETQSVLCDDDTILIIDDRANSTNGMGLSNRIHPLVKKYDSRPEEDTLYKRVFLLSFKNKQAATEFYSKAGTKSFTKLTSLPKVKLSEIYGSNATGGSGVKSSKHTTKEFEYDIEDASQGSNWDALRSRHFTESTIDVDSVKNGIYVEIDRFNIQVRGSVESHPIRYAKSVNYACDALGIKLPKVYAFKSSKIGKVKGKKNWTQLEDWVINQVKHKFGEELHRKLVERVFTQSVNEGYSHRSNHSSASEIDRHWANLCAAMTDHDKETDWKLLGLNEKSDLNDLFIFFQEKSHNKDKKELEKMINALGDWLQKANLQDKEIRDEVYNEYASIVIRCKDKYPMLARIDDDYFRSWGGSGKDWVYDCVNYVNVIDSTWNLTSK